MPVEVVAREHELAALDAFLAAPPPGVLLLEGAAGIGKTTLWEAATERAAGAGMRVLRARPVETEAQFSYVAIADLLEPVASEVLPALPEPLRRALEIALLHVAPDPGPGVPPRAVGAGLAAAVARLADDGPLLLAVDDVHWLDPASASALGFVLRRLQAGAVRVLLAERPGEAAPELALDRAPLSQRIARLDVRPLSLGALQRLLLSRLGHSPSRPVLRRLHEASGGNPFHALELGRLEATGEVPEAMRSLVRQRLTGLTVQTRRALCHLALVSSPALDVLTQALGADAGAALAPAVDAGIVDLRAGRATFTHPLYASAVVADTAPADRCAAHRALSGAARTEEERARHLALSTQAPDDAIADRLERAAEAAAARGAVAAAAQLAGEAVRLTPAVDVAQACRRRILIGMMRFVAGDSDGAEEMLAACVRDAPTEPLRASALAKLARVRHLSHSLADAIETYETAIATGVRDPALMAEAHEGLAWVRLLQRGDLEQAGAAARAAVEHARQAGDDLTRGDALSALFHVELLRGSGFPQDLVDEALAIRPAGIAAYGTRVLRDPRTHHAYALLVVDRLEEAVEAYEGVAERIAAVGDEGGLPFVLMRLSLALHLSGRGAPAADRAEEALQVAVDARQRPRIASMHCLMALLAAGRDDLAAARALGDEGLAQAAALDDGIAWRMGAWALGQAHLLAGDPEGALEHLESLHARSVEAGIRDPGENRYLADLIEALTAAGRLDEAEARARELAELGRSLRRPRAIAAGLRGRAQVRSARGDHEGAIQDVSIALDLPVPVPLETGRTKLVAGGVLRRARRRKEARVLLEAAATELTDAGGDAWARLARQEVQRVGGRPPASSELTPAERAVAELVASGRTNREAAAALFVTDRTIETHLSRIYAKLEVRSRAELAARFRDAAGQRSGISTFP